MSSNVDIQFSDNNQLHYFTGDKVSGTVTLKNFPENANPENVVQLTVHGVGEVKFSDYPGSPYNLNGQIYYDEYNYWDYELEVPKFVRKEESQSVEIPFEFEIPQKENLPSSMISKHGLIHYFVQVDLNLTPDEDEKKKQKFIREFIVQSPIEKDLKVSVGSTVEKLVLLHAGKVTLNVSINRKGHAPGAEIPVFLDVINNTNAILIPRVSLLQVQSFSTGVRHKTVETMLSEEPISGPLIEPFREVGELIRVPIPADESLTIKSAIINVRYFVHITLDIPHSIDLHVNLPIVVTAQKVLDRLA